MGMNAYQMLCLIGIPSIISGIVAMLIQKALKDRDEKEEEIRKKSQEMERQNRAIMMGLQAMLRDRLIQGYRRFFRQGWAEYEDRWNMENLWGQYHALGANGIMDEYRKRFLALPVAKPERNEDKNGGTKKEEGKGNEAELG